jgi:tetratricopeptide (TPR) repeat protein
VAVEPKVLDLLIHLLQHRGRLISREMLQRQLWPETAVSSAALSRLIKEARRVTGDDGRRQVVIETRRGRGFRLVAEVHEQMGSISNPAYVGREEMLDRIDAGLEEAAAGRGRCLLFSGEPGVGKTRTAEEAAERARQRGVQVAMAWCPEASGAPGYWPWTQALRSILADGDPSTLEARLGASAHQIARLVPELREARFATPAPPPIGDAAERFRLFDGIRAFLIRTARDTPLAIILDDLQWADAESVELLDFVAHDLSSQALLLLCTYREPELEAQSQLVRSLARLATRPSVEHWTMSGFSRREADLFIAARTGRTLDAAVVDLLCEKTEGNPLFLGEILRHAQAGGLIESASGRDEWSEVASDSLATAIELRLRALTPSARSLLCEAAAIGIEFDRSLLAQVTSVDISSLPNALDGALDEALAARLLVVRHGSTFRFSHALVREVLYGSLPREGRARLHARVAAALTTRGDDDRDLDALAHHFFQATEELGLDPAIDAAERAAARAWDMHAFDMAARHWERALQLLADRPGDEPARRCELLLRLGEAQRLIGEPDASRATFHEAAATAHALGDSVAFAEAAYGFAGLYAYGPPDPEVVSLLERAAEELEPEEEALRARILGRLASEWTLSPNRARRSELRRGAWLAARNSGELTAMVDIVAYPDHGVWDAMVAPRDRIALASDYAQRCARAGLPLFELASRVVLLDELLRCGRTDDYDAFEESVDRLAAEVREPRIFWARQLQGFTRQFMDGDFERAERRAEEALDFAGRHLDGRAAFAIWARQLAVLRSEQGRLGELREIFARIASAGPSTSNQALHAWVCAADGDADQARAVSASLLADGAAAIADEPNVSANAAVLTEVTEFLGSAEHVPGLRSLLRPYTGMNAIRTYACSHGPVDYYLGSLEELAGRPEPAEQRHRAALSFAEKMGAVPWVARCRNAWSRARTACGVSSGPG